MSCEAIPFICLFYSNVFITRWKGFAKKRGTNKKLWYKDWILLRRCEVLEQMYSSGQIMFLWIENSNFLWCSLYDQIFKPSKLQANADFHLFKAGIEPKWEDPECANGGKWTVVTNQKANLDEMWLETVMFSLILPMLSVTTSCQQQTIRHLGICLSQFLYVCWAVDGSDWRGVWRSWRNLWSGGQCAQISGQDFIMDQECCERGCSGLIICVSLKFCPTCLHKG